MVGVLTHHLPYGSKQNGGCVHPPYLATGQNKTVGAYTHPTWLPFRRLAGEGGGRVRLSPPAADPKNWKNESNSQKHSRIENKSVHKFVCFEKIRAVHRFSG